MFAFSTCWNGRRHHEGASLIDEIRILGFDRIEISHGTSVSLFPDLLREVENGSIRVVGLHNFCPSPIEIAIDAPDAYEFTAPLASDRERAIQLTLKSIDWAQRFGASYLVLHLGSARMRERTKKLEKLARAGKSETPQFERKRNSLIKARKKAGKPALDRLRDSLATILPYAEKAGIRLGFESRSHFEQVPTEEEMADLLTEYDSPVVGYWHDFGHVQRKANLGLVEHEQWLRRMIETGRYWGGHLHDVTWPDDDHQAPFFGSIDFEPLAALLPGKAPLVWEINPRRSPDQIRKSLALWIEKFGTNTTP